MSQNEPAFEGLGKRASLRLDPHAFHSGDVDSSPSPTSAVNPLSPTTPGINRPSSRGSESQDFDEERDASTGPQRSRSGSSKSDKEKRKRSRVTPEQLVHLERFFSVDRSPTAARRREISELLGMQERQTQIWFQNRRAKAKLQDGKHKGRSGSAETPPDTPPELSTGFEVDLHNLIHEDEPVTIIPCTDLSVGTWRRIATTVGKHDLVAYVCDVKRCLTWFIHSGGFGFKMEIPFDTIVDTEFTNAAPGSGLASFVLSQPPIFYLENSSAGTEGGANRHWKRCADWTEGHQATHVLRHDLIGSAVQLAHVLRNLQANTGGSDIPLRSPAYRGPTSPMELPAPPMAGLSGPGPQHTNGAEPRRRSHPAGMASSPTLAYGNDQSHNNFSPSSYSTVSGRGTPASTNFGGPLFPDFPPEQTQQPIPSYSTVPISHGLSRPFPAQPVPRTFYNDVPRLMQTYHPDNGIPQGGYENPTPSPPILTTPYHPPDLNISTNENANLMNQPLATGMPAILYDRVDGHGRRER